MDIEKLDTTIKANIIHIESRLTNLLEQIKAHYQERGN